MINIIRMSKEEILAIHPGFIDRLLSAEEIVYMAKVLGAYWSYDYEAAKVGRVGHHALLKSGLHSDGFFVSKIFLDHPTVRTIIANQIVLRFRQLGIKKPDWVAGIPDGATELGQYVAVSLGSRIAFMAKEDGRIVMQSNIKPGQTLLLVEDFCTRGTGFSEAVSEILSKNIDADVLPLELVVINRGGLSAINVPPIGSFQIVAVVDHRVNDWESDNCPLCKMGSVPIKPKATDENWQLITVSQLV